MSEKRQPEFIFQANRKNPKKGGKPIHLSVFELFPARLWKNNPKIMAHYGLYTPLPGLFRLRVDRQWFTFHNDYLFLTFHEAWRVIGTMTSDVLNVPVNWNTDTHHLKRGDRVRVMGKEGFIKTIVLNSHIDEQGIEWGSLQGQREPVPANALSPADLLERDNATSFSKALKSLKRGMALWHWPEVPDRKPPLPESWEAITHEMASQRGLDPKVSTVVALQLGGMDMHEAEKFYAKNLS